MQPHFSSTSKWQTLIIQAEENELGEISMSKSCKALLLALFVLLIPALAESQDKCTVNVSENKFLGQFLVNQTGFTLYYFSDDSKGNGASTCYEECAAMWPPFYAEELILPDSLRSVDFATITRKDGSKQTTFRGWPLYLYSRDLAAGDTFGSEQKGLWHVIDPSNQPQLI